MNATIEYRIRLKKNDLVQVISGKDKGKTGKILGVDTKNGTVTVEGVNLVKRHTKPNQKNPQGGLVSHEAPLHSSKVLLFSASANRGVRTEKARRELAGSAGTDNAKKGATRAPKKK